MLCSRLAVRTYGTKRTPFAGATMFVLMAFRDPGTP
jgi:hypothetical protein